MEDRVQSPPRQKAVRGRMSEVQSQRPMIPNAKNALKWLRLKCLKPRIRINSPLFAFVRVIFRGAKGNRFAEPDAGACGAGLPICEIVAGVEAGVEWQSLGVRCRGERRGLAESAVAADLAAAVHDDLGHFGIRARLVSVRFGARFGGIRPLPFGCARLAEGGPAGRGARSLRPGRARSSGFIVDCHLPSVSFGQSGASDDWGRSPCNLAMGGSLYARPAKGMVSDFYYHVWRYTKR